MSTSILYHGFGVRDYRYLRTEYRKGQVIFHTEKCAEKRCCVECGSREVIKKGKFIRELRTLPIGRNKVFLAVHLHRLLCRSCAAPKLGQLCEPCMSRKHIRDRAARGASAEVCSGVGQDGAQDSEVFRQKTSAHVYLLPVSSALAAAREKHQPAGAARP